MAQSDAELMRRVQRGDSDALEAFASRHERTLRLHLRRYVGPDDAEDLRQDALLRLWDRAHQWEGRGSPLAWLLRIATNLALNHIRRRRTSTPLSEVADEHEDLGDTIVAMDAFSGSAIDEAELRGQASRLLELLEQMPEDKQSVLRMARLEDMKLQDIADRLDVPLGTIKSRLHSATQWLAARWEEEE